MAFPTFLDTCTLYGAYVRDTFLRIGETGAFTPLWSADVLKELESALVRNAGIGPASAVRLKQQMRAAFPDAEVTGYEPLIGAMTCDPKDRHVLAAAVRARAEVLVTFNLKDFPEASTKQYDIEVVSPDRFLQDQLDLHPGRVISAFHIQIRDYNRPALNQEELLILLASAGLPDFADDLRRHLFDG